MRYLPAAFLFGGLVTSIQLRAPQQCTDIAELQNCRAQSANCLACIYDSGIRSFCISGGITRAQAAQYCENQDAGGGIDGGLGGLGGLGSLGGLGNFGSGMGTLDGYGNSGGYSGGGQCVPGSLCNNGGPCVICDLGSGQQGYCSDPNNFNRDLCTNPAYQGRCACVDDNGNSLVPQQQQPQIVNTPSAPVDNTINFSQTIAPLVPPEGFGFQGLDPNAPATEGSEIPSIQQDASTDPLYQNFMVPRGLTRDHIKGERAE